MGKLVYSPTASTSGTVSVTGGNYTTIGTTTIGDSSMWAATSPPPMTIEKNGDVTINGELVCKSLDDRLDRIEEMLRLPPTLRPNEELKAKYEELQEAHAAYKELEQKYITWENMKKNP